MKGKCRGQKEKNNDSGSEPVRVAIYTRKSTDEGLDQEFNSLDAQREAVEAYVKSQRGMGMVALPQRYDDGGFTGANTERPAFQMLLRDIESGKVDSVAVYKIDRLSRSLADFSRIIEFFEKQGVSFVSITQQFNTATPMGKLTLNILMSFAEFERETIAERTRDKMGAARKKGIWTGGRPMLGYDLVDKKLVINEAEAAQVRQIFRLYLERGSLLSVVVEANRRGWQSKAHVTKAGKRIGGRPFDKALVQRILTSSLYLGKVEYDGEQYEGAHEAILDEETFNTVQGQLDSHRWDRGRAARNKWNVLLMGLVRCHCGSALTHHYVSKGGKRFHYYVCEKTLKKGVAECPGSRIAMRKLEAAVIEKIRSIGVDPDLFKETAAALSRDRDELLQELKTEIRHLESEHKHLKAERQELLRTMEREENGAPFALERLVAINESLKRTSMRLEEVQIDLDVLKRHTDHEGELKAALQVFSPIWEQLFPPEKARILNLLIDSVTFNGLEQTVEIRFRPDGITTLASEFEEEVAA